MNPETPLPLSLSVTALTRVPATGTYYVPTRCEQSSLMCLLILQLDASQFSFIY